MPSFSRTWSLPVPKDSSPQTEHFSASIRLPKNFQPVGTSKKGTLSLSATLSRAPEVGIERATPLSPDLKYGIDGLRPRRDDGDRVGGADEEGLPQDHVPVAVAVRGGPESRGVLLGPHRLDQLVGVGQVGVGVAPAKVLERGAVDDRFWVGAQRVDEDGLGVGAAFSLE